MQNIALFQVQATPFPSHRISWKGANMILNQFCIDENAAFELSGVYQFTAYQWSWGKQFSPLEFLQNNSNGQVLDSAFRKIVASKEKDLETHFVFADNDGGCGFERFQQLIRVGMKKYQIKFIMLTEVSMVRLQIITKETMEKNCKIYQQINRLSVNDDIESFFKDLVLGDKSDKMVLTYFFPMLREDEMHLIEMRDLNFGESIESLRSGKLPFERNTKASELDPKFFFVLSWRFTIRI